MQEINDPYTAAAIYRQKVSELLAEAITRFEGNNVNWAQAGIYADAIKQVTIPAVQGPDYNKIKEDALKQLRALVNV